MKIIKIIFILLVVVVNTGCVGLAHSSQICCSDIEGKYYRATRVDFGIMKRNLSAIPLVVLTDLPFALVIETIEVPFIATDLHDPSPPQIHRSNDEN